MFFFVTGEKLRQEQQTDDRDNEELAEAQESADEIDDEDPVMLSPGREHMKIEPKSVFCCANAEAIVQVPLLRFLL